jgi:hypothetical protein
MISTRKNNSRELNKLLRKKPIIGIYARQRGDMYHTRAIMSLFPNLHCLILYNSEQRERKNINDIYTFLSSGGRSDRVQIVPASYSFCKPIYYGYKDCNYLLKSNGYNIPPKVCFNVSAATRFLSIKLQKEKIKSRSILKAEMAGEVLTDDEYSKMVQGRGNFPAIPDSNKYILVNFRKSGQEKNGIHPSLDTGSEGMKQLLTAVKETFTDVIVVPVGEYAPDGYLINLLEYWKWFNQAHGRSQEAGLIRYLMDNYNIVGAIGMRSGVTDSFAFLGCRVVSIDRSQEEGISRVKDLEKGLGKSTFKVVEMTQARIGERRSVNFYNRKLGEGQKKRWAGRIQDTDLQRIMACAKKTFNVN